MKSSERPQRLQKKYRFTGEAALEKLRNGEAVEILVPTELSHDGLVGVIEDSKFYQLVSTEDLANRKSLLGRIVDTIKSTFSDVVPGRKPACFRIIPPMSKRTNPRFSGVSGACPRKPNDGGAADAPRSPK